MPGGGPVRSGAKHSGPLPRHRIIRRKTSHDLRSIRHSVAVVGHYVYVIGVYFKGELVRSVERYDTIVEKWATIRSEFDEYAEGTSSITCNARHILTFGGADANGKSS